MAAAATTVFTTDFESGIPPEFSLGAGVHSVTFGAGRRLAAGVYFAKLTAGRDVRTTPVAIFQ